MIGADLREHGLAAARVKPRRRLVEDEYLRLHRNHARDGHAALLSAGELKGRLGEHVLAQADQLRRLAHAAVDLVFRKAHVARAEGDVLIDRLLEELILRILEHQPHLEAHAADLLRLGPDVAPLEQDAPLRRAQQAVEVLDKRGFA